jgi:hypothetical protein
MSVLATGRCDITPDANGHVTIPSSWSSIDNRAFHDCTSLTSVTIPDSVTSIGFDAFRNCKQLATVTIPDSVTSIGHQAFYYCTSLASVTIGDSVTSIDSRVFYCCTSLATVTIPAAERLLPAEDDWSRAYGLMSLSGNRKIQYLLLENLLIT